MTILLYEAAVSTLKDGIETIVVPVHNPWDLQDLVFHTQRGGTFDVVEWLLAQLYRQCELERVCGLSVSPQHDGTVVINLEMRQPGLQIEEWLNEGWDKIHLSTLKEDGAFRGIHVSLDRIIGEDEPRLGRSEHLSQRAVSQEKFTDVHRPWWEKDVGLVGLETEYVEHGSKTDQG